MLIVVNAMFPMFSFCKLLYLYMFRCGAREAVRVFLVFPQIAQICTDAVRGGLIPQIAPRRGRCHRCRSGAACFPTDRADCTDAVRGVLFSTQIAPLAPRSKREFCYNVTCYMLQ